VKQSVLVGIFMRLYCNSFFTQENEFCSGPELCLKIHTCKVKVHAVLLQSVFSYPARSGTLQIGTFVYDLFNVTALAEIESSVFAACISLLAMRIMFFFCVLSKLNRNVLNLLVVLFQN